MAPQTGRTVTRWLNVVIDDSGGTPRDIPVDTLSPVGFVYDEVDLTAFQDQVKGYLANHPEAEIEFGGPWDSSPVTTAAASGAAPALSGSHTVLAPLSAPAFATPLGFCVKFGVRHYWETGEPVFGIVSPSANQGYVLTKYQVEGEKYSARVKPFPGAVPGWGTTGLA
jgi:hypothetical protein